MYQALARKWRPQQFEDVVGQEHISVTLANAIKQKRLGHAYLFTGPRGIGKTTIARIFAKALNCRAGDGPTSRPCDKCDSCLEIMSGNSLDVLEIDGASNTGVDDVRELRDNVRYAPAKSRYKIYIIDEVHMLSTNAFNALLKTLEEPPEHVKFFFATTDPHKIPETIISRCQRFDLRRLSRLLIRDRLQKILDEEGAQYEEEALLTVADSADGAMRDAESILDQLLVYCAGKITLKEVSELLGLIPALVVEKFSRAIAAGDVPAVLRDLQEIFNQGWDIPKFISALVRHFRDLNVVSISGPRPEILERPEAELRTLLEESKLFSSSRLSFILEELIRLEKEIKDAFSPRISLELLLVKLARSTHRVYIEDLLTKLEQLEDGPVGTLSPPSRKLSSPPPREEASPVPRPAPPGDDRFPAIRERWDDFIATLGGERPLLKTYLYEGEPRSLKDGVLTVGFAEKFDFHKDSLESPSNLAYLENLLASKLGFAVKIKFTVAASGTPVPEARPASNPAPGKKKLVQNSPVIQAALDALDGTVIDIKD